MKQIKRILLFVEEELDGAALNRAVEIAESAGAILTLGAVVIPAQSQFHFTGDCYDLDEVENLLVEESQRQLDETASRVAKPDIDVATQVFVGDSTDVIVRAVENEEFDYLIKPPSPTQGLRRQLFGSMDMRLMRACPCPVQIVRAKPEGNSGNAVAAVDYDEGDEIKASLNQAILDSVAMALGAKFVFIHAVHIVHAWSLYGESLLASGRTQVPPERIQDAAKREETKRQEWLVRLIDNYRKALDGALASSFHPRVSLLRGDPAEVIPQRIKDLNADVLCMGTVSRGGLGGLLIGNTAEAILNRVNCSVVTLKPEGFVAPVSRR